MRKAIRCEHWPLSAISELESLCEELRALPEIQAKRAIRHAAKLLKTTNSGEASLKDKYAMPGDDAAAFCCGDGYQLLAMEGMLPKFVDSDARAAAWSSVMVNVSDIAAMGGRPTAIANAFWHHSDEKSAEIVFHIKRACDVFGVQFSGGHSSLGDNFTPNLAVAITGYAKKLLSCHHVKPGQRLFVLSDLTGSWHGDLPYWGCVKGKTDEQIRQQWAIPAELAEQELVVAAKDISNGGLLGTLIMMLELNGCGSEVDLNAIPKPEGGDLIRWLKAFQSFGFILAVDIEKINPLLSYFQGSHLTCSPIGSITDTGKIVVDSFGTRSNFWNITSQPLTELGVVNASR